MVDLGMYNRFTAQPGKRGALVEHLLKAADLMRSAAGCRLYVVNEGDGEDVWVTELWDDDDTHRASLELPGVRELVAETMPLLDGAPQQIRLRPVGGKLPS